MVAFANTAGGTLLIGVEDATRHVRGVREPLDLEERLASLISDSILPRLARFEHSPSVNCHNAANAMHAIRNYVCFDFSRAIVMPVSLEFMNLRPQFKVAL